MDSSALVLVVFIVIVALIFDFINGFHDAANSISCIVSTRVLPPKYAVYWAAAFNFLAAFIVGTPVAHTIGTGIIDPGIVENHLILAALIGAIVWNLITWWLGLPSSSSHALIGGMIGAGLVKGGLKVLVWGGIIKTASFIVLSPAIGFTLGFFYMVVVLHATRGVSVKRADNLFRRLQLFSSAIHSMGHGMNDAQKTMGVIAITLFSAGFLGPVFTIPYWIIMVCYVTIALGTLAGGWRIVKTMGTKITKLQPMGGFCAETAAASSLIGASLFGIPVSTTHTIAGAIMGVGSTRRFTAVRWAVAGTILWAWVLTIPASALISAATYFVLSIF
jgi:PiT family inorganic phosphate transporter